MKRMTDIFKSLKRIHLLGLAALLLLVSALPLQAQQMAEKPKEFASAKEYYATLSKVTVSDQVQQLLTEADGERGALKREIMPHINQLIVAAHGGNMSSGSGAARNDGVAFYRSNVRQYATMTDDGSGDSQVVDKQQTIQTLLTKYIRDGLLTQEQGDIVMAEVRNINTIGAERAFKAAKYDFNDSEKAAEIQGKIEKGTIKINDPENTVVGRECADVEMLRAKYQSGCWSCLVVEKMTSAFLNVAKISYPLSQRAGMVLLWIGVAVWVVLWGLKNVSSLSQLEPGNILNELVIFFFKVGLAYWFIIGGLPMVKNYFITPIMGFGASVGQQFWSEDLDGYVHDYVWEDELVTPEQQVELDKEVAKNNTTADETKKKAEEAPKSEEVPVEALKVPEIQSGTSPYEDLVQDFQRALVQLLNQRLQTLQNSCKEMSYIDGSKCRQKGGNSCRTSGCKDSGHVAAVKQIFIDGGSPGVYGAYCQMTVTAALQELGRQLGTDITKFQTGTGFCLDGMKIASKYKNSIIAGPGGADVKLSEALPYANIGDTVYIRVSGAAATAVGSGSGYHATTYIGGNQVISFNGDGKYNVLNAFPGGVGKIVHLNEIIRQRLQANPQAAKTLDRKELARLAEGSGLMTLINHTSGVLEGSLEDSSLNVTIPTITYSGPTDIMPKSIMNSILGATAAITNTTAENLILGDAIMCYSTLKRGGAWKLIDKWYLPTIFVTDPFIWLAGFIIFAMGLLLTIAIVYYLLDMSFKIGFAVIALPIVVGLWPFNLTKGKLAACVSIIAKAAATFAFLALTTTYTIELTKAAINWGDTPEQVAAGEGGIAKLYKVMDQAGDVTQAKPGAEDIQFAADKLALLSTNFILLLFAFLYSIKLVQNTVPDLVNKFFPDKMFGDTSPMHQWATGASKWVKDQALAPAGYARDIALNQGGEALKGGIGKIVGKIRGGGYKEGGAVSNTAKTAAKAGETAGKAVEAAGKGVQAGGKAIGAASQAANVVPVVGQAVAAAGQAAGKAVEAGGKAVETAGKAIKETSKAAGKVAEAAGKVEGAVKDAVSGGKKDEGGKKEKNNPVKDNENILG